MGEIAPLCYVQFGTLNQNCTQHNGGRYPHCHGHFGYNVTLLLHGDYISHQHKHIPNLW